MSCWKISKKNLILHKTGKSQINARLDVLKGRLITAFPDIDGYSTWVEKLAQLGGFSYTVCAFLVKYGKPEDHEAHIDIADWLIRWHRTPNPRADATFAAVAQYFSPEVHEEIRALIHDLDLEFVGGGGKDGGCTEVKNRTGLQLDSKSAHFIMPTLRPDFQNGSLVSFSVATK